METNTREERQRLIYYIEKEVKKGKRAAEIKKELKLSNSYYADLRKEVHIYSNCKICGNEFEINRKGMKYCSQECINASMREYSRQRAIRVKKQKEEGTYINGEKVKKDKDRPFTNLSCENIVIDHFEGISTKTMANMYGRTEKSIKDKLNELQANGMYDRIIRIWKLQAPHLYKRALRKRKKVTV